MSKLYDDLKQTARRAPLPSEREITEILRAARAAGMSYGEYVSRHEQAKTRREKTK